MKHDPGLHFVLGAEPDFPGLRVIQRNFEKALHTEFKIHPTLEATIRAAVELARS
ncbi:MAG: hypothetical protein P4L61_01535 [Candidatus Pacebacteria bacterium]|nr:hypothetical protein [Candidatus Paceibacterota bacterium]